jgi:hypothetical protein
MNNLTQWKTAIKTSQLVLLKGGEFPNREFILTMTVTGR